MNALQTASSSSGRVLVIGALRVPDLVPSDAQVLDAPQTIGEVRGALAPARIAPFDAAMIVAWGRDVTPRELVDEVRPVVRPGGSIAFVAPIAHRGWRGARGAMIGMLRRQRPVALHDLCGALLLGRCVDVRVRPLEGAANHAIVRALVPEPWPDDVESSSIRRSLT